MIKKHWLIWMILTLCLVSLFTLSAFSATQKDLGEKIKVEVTGHATLNSDRAIVREKALKEAFRNALEKALGAKVTTVTTMEGLTITSDVVVSQTWGHLLSYQIVKEWESKNNYYIQLIAEVSADARWWAEFEGTLSVNSLRVKDLALKQSYNFDDQVLPGGLSHDKVLVIPIRGDNFALMAVHTESLQVVWQQKLKSRLSTPLVSDGEWIVAVTNREVTVYNLLYGWIRWTYDLKEAVTETPVIYKDTLYITTQRGNLFALGLKKGDLVWKYSSHSFFVSSPAIAGDRIYFTDSQGYLHVLDIARRSRVYKQLVNTSLYAHTPTPTSIFTYLAWNDGRDSITALNSVDGTTVWDFKGKVDKATIVLTPYLFNNKLLVVFVHRNQSKLYLLDARSGQLYWEKEMKETVIEITGASEGLILLNTWEGIRILDSEYGSLIWDSGAYGLKTHVIFSDDRLYYMYDQNVDIYW